MDVVTSSKSFLAKRYFPWNFFFDNFDLWTTKTASFDYCICF